MRPQRTSQAIIAIITVLTLTAAGCGRQEEGGGGSGESAPGITDTTVKLGGSFPLSGPVAQPGTAQSGGLIAFFEAINEAGGVEMQDGKTRKIEFIRYDDAYDPARTVQNFRKLVDQDQILAYVGALGTPTNAAVMPVANEEGVPHMYLATGASMFSANQEENPWTVGWQPTYEQEGRLFGELVAGMGRPLKAAVLYQNDDLGEAYLSGFEAGIEGSQVEIVAEQTHERTDSTLDSQITNLAASGADVLLSAVSVPGLQVSALSRMRQLNWAPITFLPVLTATIDDVVKASGADQFLDELYSSNVVKMPNDPQWADDPAVTEYLERMEQYSPDADPEFANAVWGYATGDTIVRVLESMTEMTRQGFRDAANNLKADDIAMLLPGVSLDGTSTDTPPVTGNQLVKFGNGQWNLVEGG